MDETSKGKSEVETKTLPPDSWVCCHHGKHHFPLCSEAGLLRSVITFFFFLR